MAGVAGDNNTNILKSVKYNGKVAKKLSKKHTTINSDTTLKETKKLTKSKVLNENKKGRKGSNKNIMNTSNIISSEDQHHRDDIKKTKTFKNKLKLNSDNIRITEKENTANLIKERVKNKEENILNLEAIDTFPNSQKECNSNMTNTIVKQDWKPILHKEIVDKKANNKNKKSKELDKKSAIVVRNLPASMVLIYRPLLKEHFSKYGEVKHISIADMNTADFPNQMFRATIFFDSNEASTMALKENNSLFGGSIINVEKHKLKLKRKAVPTYGWMDKNKGCSGTRKHKDRKRNQQSDDVIAASNTFYEQNANSIDIA